MRKKQQEDSENPDKCKMEENSEDYMICYKKHLVQTRDKERVRARARGGSVLECCF